MQLHVLLPIVLVPAKLAGEAARRIRVPAVVGEILVGFLLGASVLDILPEASRDPAGYSQFRELAEIGLCVLLFRIGLETRVADFVRIWRQALLVAVIGMIAPFALGMGLTLMFGFAVMAAVFVGAALTATSVGVTVSVLSELKAESSPEGHVLLGAAVLDDLLGLLLLAVVVSLAQPGASVVRKVAIELAQGVSVLALGFFVGLFIVRLTVWLSRWSQSKSTLVVLSVSYFLLIAYLAEIAGLATIIGAYAAGLAFARHPDGDELAAELEPLIGLLTPLFFVLIGASVDLAVFSHFGVSAGRLVAFTLLLLTVAVAGKLVSPLPLKAGKFNRLAIGCGMVPRGEIGLVFAYAGSAAGALSPELFAVIIIALVATTVIGPLCLRAFWRHQRGPGRQDRTIEGRFSDSGLRESGNKRQDRSV